MASRVLSPWVGFGRNAWYGEGHAPVQTAVDVRPEYAASVGDRDVMLQAIVHTRPADVVMTRGGAVERDRAIPPRRHKLPTNVARSLAQYAASVPRTRNFDELTTLI